MKNPEVLACFVQQDHDTLHMISVPRVGQGLVVHIRRLVTATMASVEVAMENQVKCPCVASCGRAR